MLVVAVTETCLELITQCSAGCCQPIPSCFNDQETETVFLPSVEVFGLQTTAQMTELISGCLSQKVIVKPFFSVLL